MYSNQWGKKTLILLSKKANEGCPYNGPRNAHLFNQIDTIYKSPVSCDL